MAESKMKKALMDQLRAKNADVEPFEKLVDDYLWFYNQLKAMKKDIKERGRTYYCMSSQGKEYEKDNPSVQNALRYSQQMIKILDKLGLDPNTVSKEEEDDLDADL